IQSESVNYVWARPILLATLLCLASLSAWLDGRRWLAVVWFAAALVAKEECAAFPLVLLWLQVGQAVSPALRVPDQLEGRREWLPIGTMLTLSLAAGARVVWALSVTAGAPAGAAAGISPARYLLAQGPVVLRYLQLIVVPYGFTVDADMHT